jgi:predicted RNA binding protein YcfA (HicA-like mRNA interferase family)
LKALSGKAFAKILEKKGWELARVHGSHHIYIKSGRTERISVPIHKNQSLKIGLQRHLMKIAEISENEL